jgi:pimeloyl-ACP methyl ester carboxylesterase
MLKRDVDSTRVVKPKEGFASIIGFDIFYKQFGRPKKGEILCLHGGPGATHDWTCRNDPNPEEPGVITFSILPSAIVHNQSLS